MPQRFLQWLRDDRGQDLIEYALLTGAIALAGVAGYTLIANSIGSTYSNSNETVQDLWEVPAP